MMYLTLIICINYCMNIYSKLTIHMSHIRICKITILILENKLVTTYARGYVCLRRQGILNNDVQIFQLASRVFLTARKRQGQT